MARVLENAAGDIEHDAGRLLERVAGPSRDGGIQIKLSFRGVIVGLCERFIG